MAAKEIIQSNVLLMTIIGIICGSIQLLCKLRKDDVASTTAPETSSRKLVKVLLITGAISDLFNLISLFMSTASGNKSRIITEIYAVPLVHFTLQCSPVLYRKNAEV